LSLTAHVSAPLRVSLRRQLRAEFHGRCSRAVRPQDRLRHGNDRIEIESEDAISSTIAYELSSGGKDDPGDRSGQPLPIGGLGCQLLSARFGQRVELDATFGVAD